VVFVPLFSEQPPALMLGNGHMAARRRNRSVLR
jgi:hypothetical protein